MKKLLLILLCLPLMTLAQQTYVPDDNFENYLEANGMGNGIPNDDNVFTSDIDTVTGLDVSSQNIADLTGIEDFTALTYLECVGNQLTSLDVSNNTALTYLNCWENQLTSLDISNNTDLHLLGCQENQLTSLDLSNNTALTYLSCHGNPNLTCISVDDPAWSTANWTHIDPQHYFSTSCPETRTYIEGYEQTAQDYFDKAYNNKSDWQYQIDNYTRAIQIDPDYSDAYYNRGRAYLELGNNEECIADNTRAIRIGPEHALAYRNRGIAKENLGLSYCSDYKKACDLGDEDCCEWYYKQCR